MSRVTVSGRAVPTYGYLALMLGILLCWYAVWTVACNVLVLAGVHYSVLLWVPILPTVVTAIAAARYGRTIVAHYSAVAERVAPSAGEGAPPLRLGMVAAAFAVALVTAQLTQKFQSVPVVLAGAIVVAAILYRATPADTREGVPPAVPEFGWRLVALLLLVYAIYLFGHRFDGDDANFVNLAIGAKHTVGYVYQFDTMLGDGPNLIHLPTYKFHSFELLGAVLSSYSGLEPVYIFHLVLPVLLIPFLVAVLAVALGPSAGPRWLPAAVLWLAFLFFNLISMGGWGLHGVVRLLQGKGFFVSAVLPLIVVLTVRWFKRGERSDLVGLLLANVCAVGFSANGIYGGPVASVMAALPFVLTRPRDGVQWRRLLALAPTFAWPVFAIACILLFGLAYPSEVLTVQSAPKELNFITWYGIGGRIILALLLISGIGLVRAGFGRTAALLYVPLFLVLTMNPLGWAIVVKLTGNLGFRIFWSLPGPVLVALLGVALLDALRLRSERAQIAAALAILAASIFVVSRNDIPSQTVSWHSPGLRVDQGQWATTTVIAKQIDPRCHILLPEHYTMLLSMQEGVVKPVAVRHLYMVHYRFTLPQRERILRAQLLRLADGTPIPTTIDANLLRREHVPLDAVAADPSAPTFPQVEALAHSLGLSDRGMRGPLRLWANACYRPDRTATR